jgi:Tfp pilus assembly protein PilO
VDKMKQWVALAAVAALVILAGGWFLLVSPKRSSAADLRAQADGKLRANQALQTTLADLRAKAKDLPAQQAKLAAVAAKIPDNSAMPNLIRALNAAADSTGVELVSMAPGQPTAVAPAVAAAKVTTPTTVSGTATTPNAAAGSAAVGALQSIPVNLSVVGSYFQVAEYLDRLENLTRAFRVTSFSLAPGLNPVKPDASQPALETGKVLNAAISGLVFETQGGTTSTLSQTAK